MADIKGCGLIFNFNTPKEKRREVRKERPNKKEIFKQVYLRKSFRFF